MGFSYTRDIVTIEDQAEAREHLSMSDDLLMAHWLEHHCWRSHRFRSEHSKRCKFAYWKRYQARVLNAELGSEVCY